MGVESEGEEERVELDKDEVDLLEKGDDGAPGDGDGDAPGDDLPPSDDDEGEEEDEAAGGRADGTAEVRAEDRRDSQHTWGSFGSRSHDTRGFSAVSWRSSGGSLAPLLASLRSCPPGPDSVPASLPPLCAAQVSHQAVSGPRGEEATA